MARPGFKTWWSRILPKEAERSTFVLIASLLLCLMYWKWQPMDGVIWDVSGSITGTVLTGVLWLGWLTVLLSTFLINHFDLFGLRQVFLANVGKAYHHPAFAMTGLYKLVRHPIMIGFIIAFWAAPVMSTGHLVFAITTTVYIVIGVHFEERDLAAALGDDYAAYQKRVPMLVPFTKRGE